MSKLTSLFWTNPPPIHEKFNRDSNIVLYCGDALKLLEQIPDETARLVVTSPPYNIGKPYEKKLNLGEYVKQQELVIKESARILRKDGSICWQVGNYVENSAIIPLDVLLYPIFDKLGLKLRNRIVWHFGHGLHAQKRFSGRYEVIIWFTKSDNYVFNLDSVRIPQKYPNKKYFKGPKRGKISSHPMGKNPTDIWEIPNVKSNHPEKTIHPCQFPVELIERLVLALTNPEDWVVDPFIGVGSTAIAALIHNRKAAGADIVDEYIKVARQRINLLFKGKLNLRPLGKPIYTPPHLKMENNVSLFEKVFEYSHLGGLEILKVRYPQIEKEIDEIIDTIKISTKTKVSKEKTMKGKLLYSPKEMNKAFKEYFHKKGYKELKDFYDVDAYDKKHKIRAFKQIDFLKERVLVEVQFGKYAFMFYDLAKFQYFYNKNQADVGVEIVPCYYLHKEMSTGVSYGEQLVYDIERLQRNFPGVPIKVIFIDV